MIAVLISSFIAYPIFGFILNLLLFGWNPNSRISIFDDLFGFFAISSIQFFPWILLAWILSQYTKYDIKLFLFIPIIITLACPGLFFWILRIGPLFPIDSPRMIIMFYLSSFLSILVFYKLSIKHF